MAADIDGEPLNDTTNIDGEPIRASAAGLSSSSKSNGGGSNRRRLQREEDDIDGVPGMCVRIIIIIIDVIRTDQYPRANQIMFYRSTSDSQIKYI